MLKEREAREKAFREAEERRIAAESVAYFPFGRYVAICKTLA